MLGIFKSKEQRELEAISKALDSLLDEAQQEISCAENQKAKQDRVITSVLIRSTVLRFPRNLDSIRQIHAEVERLRSENIISRALGLMIGSRLIMAGIYLKKFSGKEWFDAAMTVACLQGLIHGYMERLGDKPWPVSFVEEINFENYRKEYLAKLDERIQFAEDE